MEKPFITRRVSAGSRVYYIDAHTDRKGQHYIAISEIPTGKPGAKRRRHRVFVHRENLDKFSKAIAEVAGQLKDDPKG